MTEVKRYQTDDYPMIEFVDVEDYDTLSTQNEELRKQLATAQQELDEAKNEASTCDDIPLKQPLAGVIADLQKARELAEAALALTKVLLDAATRAGHNNLEQFRRAQIANDNLIGLLREVMAGRPQESIEYVELQIQKILGD